MTSKRAVLYGDPEWANMQGSIADLARTVEGATGIAPIWDPVAGEYTNISLAAFLASRRNGRMYGVKIPKSLATECQKTLANQAIPNPVPSTLLAAGSDQYRAEGGPFFILEVNGHIDNDGVPHVTAIQGDGKFTRTPAVGNDVWILAPVLWWSMTEDASFTELVISDTPMAGLQPQPKATLPDGTFRPYMLYAKYLLSMTGSTPRSVSGGLVRTRDVSHNTLRTITKATTTGYSGLTSGDEWYLKTMFLMKYGTKNSQSIFAGHASYSVQLNPAIGETGVRRVLVTKAQGAQILIGSTWSLGDGSSTDRGNVGTRNIFESARVVSKQDVGDQTSIVFDTAAPFNTATTQLLSVMPWRTGACDDVPGDGSPYNPLSGAEPFTCQGIEDGLGVYKALMDVINSNDGESGWVPYVVADTQKSSTALTADYRAAGPPLPTTGVAGWKYPLYPVAGSGLLYGADQGASTTTGLCDGTYTNTMETVGTREWLAFGYLSSGANAGLWGVDATNSLTSANWNIASRQSGLSKTPP